MHLQLVRLTLIPPPTSPACCCLMQLARMVSTIDFATAAKKTQLSSRGTLPQIAQVRGSAANFPCILGGRGHEARVRGSCLAWLQQHTATDCAGKGQRRQQFAKGASKLGLQH